MASSLSRTQARIRTGIFGMVQSCSVPGGALPWCKFPTCTKNTCKLETCTTAERHPALNHAGCFYLDVTRQDNVCKGVFPPARSLSGSGRRGVGAANGVDYLIEL